MPETRTEDTPAGGAAIPDPPVPTLASIMIDCADLEAVVEFWTRLLGVGVAARLPGYVWLTPQVEGAYELSFQQVDDPTPGKNKVHLDMAFDDLDALTARVESLGGRMVEHHAIPQFVWNVYADVEDNVFCVGHRPT